MLRGPDNTFRGTGPALRSGGSSSSRTHVLTARDATSITSAYNGFIDEAGAMTDVEVLVLLHDDVGARDWNIFCAPFLLCAPGTPGSDGGGGRRGRGKRAMQYVLLGGSDYERESLGRIWFLDFGPPRGDVDVVDGLLSYYRRQPWRPFGSTRQPSMVSMGTTPTTVFPVVRAGLGVGRAVRSVPQVHR